MIFFSSWNPLHVLRQKVTRQVQFPNHDVCKIAKKIEEDRVQNRKKKIQLKIMTLLDSLHPQVPHCTNLFASGLARRVDCGQALSIRLMVWRGGNPRSHLWQGRLPSLDARNVGTTWAVTTIWKPQGI